MSRILLIDDTAEMGSLIEIALKPHSVRHVLSLAEADRVLHGEDFHLILIDVTLPDGDGFDFCQRLAHDPKFEKIPRILLTAKDQPSEKVYGFSCGADDYITKPFNLSELKARADRSLSRIETGAGEKNFARAGFEFDLEFQRCFVLRDGGKRDLGLTPTEFHLFLSLVKNENHVLSRTQLEQMVWKSRGIAIEARGVDSHVAHLRKKLKDLKGMIQSVYGQGYSFQKPAVLDEAA